MARGVYVDDDALKRTLTLTGTSFADYDIAPAIAAASRAVDEYCGRQFDRINDVEQSRFYRPVSPSLILIDDLIEITELRTFQWGLGSTEKVWTPPSAFPEETPHFLLEPNNAIEDGYPYTRIVLNTFGAVQGFPSWSPQSAKVTGKWGWPALPDQVVTATTLIATRTIKRIREAPFGVIMGGMDIGGAIRIARTDPDVCQMLAPYVREKVISSVV
jgi:hypothetical protein